MPCDYSQFLASKTRLHQGAGLDPTWMPASLFPFQRQIVTWALTQGRAALFLDTGLGKTRIQLVWAQHVVEQAGKVLIVTPLAVAQQTAREAEAIGLGTTICRTQADVRPGINLVNYERIHRMDTSAFAGVVLDESSILKAFNGATRQQLTTAFAATPYRLCCTATPAPNDHMELGTHAEFLGVMTRSEMLSTYFVHDGGSTASWRLKGHAVEPFWTWVSTWAVALRDPAMLGDTTPGYILPPLHIQTTTLPSTGMTADDTLFLMEARTLTEQRVARRAGLEARIQAMATCVNASVDPWIVWCDLNDEGDALCAAIPDAIQVAGADTLAEKESRLLAFGQGRARVLVSKPSICGYGLNWQHCAHVGFVGVSHSFESWYQAIRRCYRFGQTRPVTVQMFALDVEAAILRNLDRKRQDAEAMHTVMSVNLLRLGGHETRQAYAPTRAMHLPAWLTTQEASYAHVS